MKNSKVLVALALCLSHFFSTAQDDKWDVTKPDSLNREVTISVDEGTWMNLDISPDGKQIVFDMLGDIYVMPIGGGDATVIREGHAFEVQPRFSPTGKMISIIREALAG